MRELFKLQKTDRAALQTVLNDASHASITPATSDVAKVVQSHLDKAILCMYWCFHVELYKYAIELIFALMQLCVYQSAGLVSKALRLFKRKFAKGNRRESDSSDAHAVKDMCSQFAEAKPELLLRFGDDGDNDESAFTMVVWDFGGQRVSCVM